MSIKDTWLDWYKDGRIEESLPPLVKLLFEAKVRRVLDFGTGTGRHTVYLAKIGFEVYGFDWSENAVGITKKELFQQGLSANLAVWDMNNIPLPYGNEFFDAVIAINVLHHTYIDKIKRTASDIARITRSGGYLYVESPTYGEVMRQKRAGASFDETEPGTFIPLDGDEIGVPHHHFKLDEILDVFVNFRPISLEERNEHYCLTAIRK